MQTTRFPIFRGSFHLPNMRWQVPNIVVITPAGMINQKYKLMQVAHRQKCSDTANLVDNNNKFPNKFFTYMKINQIQFEKEHETDVLFPNKKIASNKNSWQWLNNVWFRHFKQYDSTKDMKPGATQMRPTVCWWEDWGGMSVNSGNKLITVFDETFTCINPRVWIWSLGMTNNGLGSNFFLG